MYFKSILRLLCEIGQTSQKPQSGRFLSNKCSKNFEKFRGKHLR